MINDYALLTRLPLLQGISSTELLHLEDVLKLDIDELPASKLPVIRQGDPCTQLLWLVEGELMREHRSDSTYSTRSSLQAPAVIEVDRLFGLYTTYEYTYWAKTDVKMLSIRKSLISSHLMKSEVFRLNLLNLYATQAQKLLRQPWRHRPESLSDRIVRFLVHHCVYPAGPKTFHILMTQLAAEVGDSRLDVSRVLNQLQRDGLLHLHRGRIEVPQMERLIG